MNNAESITSKQLIFVIIGAQIGMAVFSLPRLVSAEACQDACISVALGALVPLLQLLIIERLGRRMPDLNFFGMNKLLFGRWLGSALVVIYVAYVIFLQGTLVRVFAEITVIFLLPHTPIPVVALTVAMTIIFIVSQGARVVARLNEILFWIILPLVFLFMVPLFKNSDYTNLLPVGGAGIKAIALGIPPSFNAFSGTEVLLVFYSLVKRKDEVLKAGLLGTSYTAMIYLLVTVESLLIWGPEMIQTFIWPVITVFKSTKVWVIERPELILLTVWTSVGIRPAMTNGFAAFYALSDVLHVNREKYFHWVVMAGTLAMFTVALLPGNLLVTFKLTEIVGYVFLWTSLLHPLIMLVFSLFRGKEVKNV